jgi:acetyl esterase
MKRARLSALADSSHLWALRRARAAIHVALSGRDHLLPQLAESRRLQLPGAEGPLEGRLYRPTGVSVDAPLLLFFHGGGFVVSDLDTHEALCIRLADAGRMRVLSAEYRLAPEHRYPAQLDDAMAVTRWMLGEGASGLDLGRGVAVGGDSAGAYLAASTAAHLHADFPGAIRAQLLIYPLLQLDGAVWAESLFEETRAIGWAAVQYINAQLLGAGVTAPSLLSLSEIAPLDSVIVAGGLLDPCKVDAVVLADLLRKAGREVVWRDYPDLIHGFGNLTHVSEAARQAVAETGALIGQVMTISESEQRR